MYSSRRQRCSQEGVTSQTPTPSNCNGVENETGIDEDEAVKDSAKD
jgi:hypothetical protein